MKKKRHTPEQISHKLRQADAELAAGRTIAELCQKLAISEQTFHRWRNQYGGMKANEARRLKELEREIARLKKPVADHARAGVHWRITGGSTVQRRPTAITKPGLKY